MLNGGYGDFCLQTKGSENNIEEYFSQAWSSNTKHYIIVVDDKVKVFNWATTKSEDATQKQVLDNLEKFYNYILSKSYKTERDVVPFIIDLFRQLRNVTGEKNNPKDALNLLFVLLASLEDNYSEIDYAKWNINSISIPPRFDYFVDKIRIGNNDIKPNLSLILRHSAGVLFQEAQKEVMFFNSQDDLFGGVSNKLQTSPRLYSSVHYTPPYLARTIVESSLKEINLNAHTLNIFDPACGSAEFLIETLKQLKELKYNGCVNITGWDTSETAINTSNFLLEFEKRTVWNDKIRYQVRLVKDSLKESWNDNYDLILMNPPFVSWELLKDSDERDSVRSALGSAFSGKPNQASAFFYKSIQALNELGVLGCVVPSSLLIHDAYLKLRNDSNDLIDILLLGKLGNFVFEDALADVSIIVGKKKKLNTVPQILWTSNEKGVAQTALRHLRRMSYSNELTVNEKEYNIYQPANFPIIENTWKAVSFKESELLLTLNRFIGDGKLSTVESVFNVQQGVRTGNNNLFKISKSAYAKLPTAEKQYFRPVADNDSIDKGVLSPNNYLWYPYDNSGLTISSEKEFKAKAPVFYKALLPHKTSLSNRARKDNTNWWVLSEHRAWLRTKSSRLISSEFGNSDSFAFDKSGQFAVERGYAWIPKKAFVNSDYYFYLALFSNSFFDRLLSIYSKQLAGGNWYNLSKMDTKHIPIPNIHVGEVKLSPAYLKLVDIGKEITRGNIYIKNISADIVEKYYYRYE